MSIRSKAEPDPAATTGCGGSQAKATVRGIAQKRIDAVLVVASARLGPFPRPTPHAMWAPKSELMMSKDWVVHSRLWYRRDVARSASPPCSLPQRVVSRPSAAVPLGIRKHLVQKAYPTRTERFWTRNSVFSLISGRRAARAPRRSCANRRRRSNATA